MNVRRLVAALTLLGLLVSCSDGDPTSDPPEPTSSATPTDRVPPTPSEESRESTGAGARAFVRFWVDSFNYAMQTGDTNEFRRLSSEDCNSCTKIVRVIEEIYGPGGNVESDGWRIKRFTDTSLAGNSKASVSALISLSPQVIHHAGNEKPDRHTGGEGNASFSLYRVGTGWRVSKIVQGTT